MEHQKVIIPVHLDDKEIGSLTIISFYPVQYSKSYFKNHLGNFHNIMEFDKVDDETPIQYCDLGNGNCIMLLEETKYQIFFKTSKDFKDIEIIPTIRKMQDGVFEPLNISSESQNEGNLNFHSYAGKSFFDVELDGKRSDLIPFEVRSKKINYYEQYIEMIADLSKAMSGILFYQNAPLFQSFIHGDKLRNTYYEDYMFLEYLFLEENLPYAYEYVRKNIYSNLKEDLETVPTSFASNIGYSGLVNIVCNYNLLHKTENTPLNWPSSMKNYVPDSVTQSYYEETVDTPENRLLKYFLEAIDSLIEKLLKHFIEENYIGDRLLIFEDKIQEYLSDRWLRDVGKLEMIPMNSQVLQKKEGYRDIFKYYLNFEFGFRPIWEEMEDLIKGYERKLSELYEFWCYFKLLKIMGKISGQKISYEDVFNLSKGSVGLKIGLKSSQKFKFCIDNNEIELKLFYNKSFRKGSEYGSYSLNLRPDYTLSINGDYFIHFDAKYKSRGIPKEDEFNKKDHIYKFEDVYKIHTYKDAILNTKGSYVLYPGDKVTVFREAEGIIPSVGAFPLTPGKNGLEEEELILFIKEILEHMIKRTD